MSSSIITFALSGTSPLLLASASAHVDFATGDLRAEDVTIDRLVTRHADGSSIILFEESITRAIDHGAMHLPERDRRVLRVAKAKQYITPAMNEFPVLGPHGHPATTAKIVAPATALRFTAHRSRVPPRCAMIEQWSMTLAFIVNTYVNRAVLERLVHATGRHIGFGLGNGLDSERFGRFTAHAPSRIHAPSPLPAAW